MLAHAAEMQAKWVIAEIVGTPRPTEEWGEAPVPAAIFTEPEAACVGPSEDQLKAQGTPYECRKAFWRANGKALTMGQTEGMLKLFSEPDAGRIIGCHAYGAHAADIVQEASVLMCCNATVEQLRYMVHIHPTLGEILLTAAEQ
jgi:dihydrolipoamide dehydrogenase